MALWCCGVMSCEIEEVRGGSTLCDDDLRDLRDLRLCDLRDLRVLRRCDPCVLRRAHEATTT